MKVTALILLCLLSASITSGQAVKPITLGESHEIHSTILSEKRILNIYLPEGCSANDTTRYPVIYLLDGGLDEDFIHVTGLVQFNSFSWIGRMPGAIVVGIANIDRKRDMTYPTTIKSDKHKYPTTGGSAKFIDFIEKEVQPYIKGKFRTGRSRTLIGESLGGLLAAEILLTRPYLFNKYIIISPSIWWDHGSLLRLPAKMAVKEKTSIYIGVGKEGLAPGKYPHVMEVDAHLLEQKIQNLRNSHITTYLDYLPAENHATVGHQAVFNAFKWLWPASQAK